MIELLGDHPSKQWVLSGKYSKEFFLKSGKLKHIKKLKFWSLSEVLIDKYKVRQEEATEQRKEEHAAYEDLIASDTAAKELLEFAKNRLNKFYNPKLYKAAFVAEGGTIPTAAAGVIAGTGISAAQVAPPP